MSTPRKLVLLGATGSIGESCLKVIRKHPDKINLIGISANSQAEKLASIAREFEVEKVHLCQEPKSPLEIPAQSEFLTGQENLCQLAAWSEADLVLVAVVGAAGLPQIGRAHV